MKSESGMSTYFNAFRIEYKQALEGKKVKEPNCYIHARNFLEYMAGIIGVPVDSPSLRFRGQSMPDGTVFVDLNRYEIIERKKQKHKCRQ